MRMARRILAASASGLLLATTLVPTVTFAASSGTSADTALDALASQLVLLSAKVNSSSTAKAEAAPIIQAIASSTFDWDQAIFGSDSLNAHQQAVAAAFIPTLKSVATFSINSQSQAVTLIENLVGSVQQVAPSIATDSVVNLLQNIESDVIFSVVPSIRQQMTKNPKMTESQLETALETTLNQNIDAAVQSSGSEFVQLFDEKASTSSTSGTGATTSGGSGQGSTATGSTGISSGTGSGGTGSGSGGNSGTAPSGASGTGTAGSAGTGSTGTGGTGTLTGANAGAGSPGSGSTSQGGTNGSTAGKSSGSGSGGTNSSGASAGGGTSTAGSGSNKEPSGTNSSTDKGGGSKAGSAATGKGKDTKPSAQHKPGIYINGRLVNQAPEIRVQRHVNMSLASVMWVLKKGDITSKWNGRAWYVSLAVSNGIKWPRVPHGKGQVDVFINGHLVFKTDKKVVKDKTTGRVTTYLPIGAIIPVLRQMGLHVTWSGSELNVVERTGR